MALSWAESFVDVFERFTSFEYSNVLYFWPRLDGHQNLTLPRSPLLYSIIDLNAKTMATDKELIQLLDRLDLAPTEAQSGAHTNGLANAPNDNSETYSTTKGAARRQPHHQVLLEYPIRSLMPAGAELFLLEPSDVEYRERPKKDRFHLDTHTLDYRLTVDLDAVMPPYAAKGHAVGRLVSIMDHVSKHPGGTVLNAISFTLGDVFCCRMEVQAFAVDATKLAEGTIDLSLDDMEELVAITSRGWTRLLSDLVSRTSDRAYLYVEGRLRQQWGDDFAREDKEQWRNVWGSRTPRSAAELFRTRLLDTQTEEPAYGTAHDSGPFDVKLPCDHLLRTTKAEMAAVPVDVARVATCVEDRCRSRIMKEADDIELNLRHELALRDGADQLDDAWNDLDLEDLSLVRHAVPVYLFPQVLREAIRAFEVPRSASPLELSLLHCEETEFATHVIDAWVKQQPEVLRISSAKLFRQLKDLVSRALDETSSPGHLSTPTPSEWKEFLSTLLTRAINFLVHRGCNDGSEDHEGLHYHDDMYFYSCVEVEARLMVGEGVSDEVMEKKLQAMIEGEDQVMEDLGADSSEDDTATLEWDDVDLRSIDGGVSDVDSSSSDESIPE